MSKVKCPECRGKGEIPCPLEYGGIRHPDSCPTCGGDPQFRMECNYCEGEGKIDDE